MEQPQVNQALEYDPFRKLVHLWPLHAWTGLAENCTRRSQHNVVDLPLLLSELTVNREARSDIRDVVMKRMALVCQHSLAVHAGLVSLVIVKGGSLVSAAADRDVRGDSASEVVLFTMELEEAFELRLPHSRLDVFHHVYVTLGRDLGGPF
jgi:hypothetical protein